MSTRGKPNVVLGATCRRKNMKHSKKGCAKQTRSCKETKRKQAKQEAICKTQSRPSRRISQTFRLRSHARELQGSHPLPWINRPQKTMDHRVPPQVSSHRKAGWRRQRLQQKQSLHYACVVDASEQKQQRQQQQQRQRQSEQQQMLCQHESQMNQMVVQLKDHEWCHRETR